MLVPHPDLGLPKKFNILSSSSTQKEKRYYCRIGRKENLKGRKGEKEMREVEKN